MSRLGGSSQLGRRKSLDKAKGIDELGLWRWWQRQSKAARKKILRAAQRSRLVKNA